MATCSESLMCELCSTPTFADVRHRGTWLCYAHRAETIANEYAALQRQEEVPDVNPPNDVVAVIL